MNPLVPSFSAFERVRSFYVIDRQDGFTQNNRITDALTGPKLSRSGCRYCLQHIWKKKKILFLYNMLDQKIYNLNRW